MFRKDVCEFKEGGIIRRVGKGIYLTYLILSDRPYE